MPSTSWSLLQGFMVLSFMAVALQLVMCMSIRLRKGRRVQYQVCSIIAALLLTMAVIFMMLAPNKFIDLCIPDSKNISYSTTFGVGGIAAPVTQRVFLFAVIFTCVMS
jgi:hypothetical protein